MSERQVVQDIPGSLALGDLLINKDEALVEWKGEAIYAPRSVMAAIHALAARPGIIKDRDALMDAVYGVHSEGVDFRSIDSLIKRARKAFKIVDPSFDKIETVYGFGYRWRREDQKPRPVNMENRLRREALESQSIAA